MICYREISQKMFPFGTDVLVPAYILRRILTCYKIGYPPASVFLALCSNELYCEKCNGKHNSNNNNNINNNNNDDDDDK